MTGESRAVRIPAEIFNSLRACCIEIRDIVAENPEGRVRIEAEPSTSVREAFGLGVLAATMALQGRSAIVRQTLPEKTQSRQGPEAETGGQLKLFE